jgi:phosphoribosyl 1,2-cyclic phosphodiesterase
VQFASLGSGSRGNGTLVRYNDTLVLVDCGFSLRQVEARMQRLEAEPTQIDAILVTHEHTDHCSGVGRLSRKYDIPVYLTHGTADSGRCDDVHEQRYFRSEDEFRIGDIEVHPVSVPHDAREPCQFVFIAQGKKLGVLTDLGSLTPVVLHHYRNCDALLLECNHDAEMLQQGSYPPALKRRVGGDWGHLNNLQAAELLGALERDGLQHLVVAHISEQNNSRERVQQALDTVWNRGSEIVWANQSEGFDWLHLV